MNTSVPAYVEHLALSRWIQDVLEDFGNPDESSRQSNRTQENYNHVDVSR
jgi:hypothetical protein